MIHVYRCIKFDFLICIQGAYSSVGHLGAMENFGLMTFRDILLLYEKDKSTERNLEQVALVVCHEVAHQWFGNYGK